MKPADARDRLEERLLSLLYDELPDGEAEALRAELAADPKAAARFAEWQALRSQLDALPTPEPDPQVHYDILREARKAASPDPAVGGFWGWLERLSFSPALAGLGLMAAAAGLFAIFNTMQTEQADLAPAAEPTAAASAVKAVPQGAVSGLPGASAPSAGDVQALGAAGALADEADKAQDADEAEAEPTLEEGRAGLARGVEAKREEAKPKLAKRKPAKNKRAQDMRAKTKAPAQEAVRATGKVAEKQGAAVDDLVGALDPAKDGAPAKRPRRAAAKAAPPKRAAKKRTARARDGADLFASSAKGGGGASRPAARPKPKSAEAAAPQRAEAPPAQEPAAPRQYAPPPPPAAPAPAPADEVAAEQAAKATVTAGPPAPSGDAAAEDRFDAPVVGGARAPEAERAPAEPPAEARGGAVRVLADAATADAAKADAAKADAAKADAAKADDSEADDSEADGPEADSTLAVNQGLAEGGDAKAPRRARRPQADQPASPLAGARAARSAGRLREAAAAYEDVIRTQRSGPTLQQAWFEAAQTYERLGDRLRAIQLYRLVAAAGGSNAAAARARINALTAPGTGNANRPPVAAPMDATESARPPSVKE